jgi:hypothetical protein
VVAVRQHRATPWVNRQKKFQALKGRQKCGSRDGWKFVKITAMSQSEKRSRMQKAFVPLSKAHPLLAAQWHPTKNGNVIARRLRIEEFWPPE